jgi:hypothetical protein
MSNAFNDNVEEIVHNYTYIFNDSADSKEHNLNTFINVPFMKLLHDQHDYPESNGDKITYLRSMYQKLTNHGLKQEDTDFALDMIITELVE